MRTIHHTILTMPIPSLDEIVAADPLALERAMTITEAAEFCGIHAEGMRTMRRRGQGPQFRKLKGFNKVVTTPRACIEWLKGETLQARRARSNIQGRAK